MNKINTDYTDEIVCPYCGYVNGDSWEHYEDSGQIMCGECEKMFFYQRYVSATYSSRPLKDASCTEENPCCDRRNEYNGLGSGGPLKFTCPKHCSCHD
jgi:hypothetical protein